MPSSARTSTVAALDRMTRRIYRSLGLSGYARMDFRVAAPTAYTLTGYVSTAVALDEPEVASCQINGVVLAGDTRATPLPAGTYPILDERFLYPEETASLECSAKSSGALGESNEVAFEVAVNGLPESCSA